MSKPVVRQQVPQTVNINPTQTNLQANINLLPPISSDEMERLEKLKPGFAERLLAMVEKEQNARIELMKKEQENSFQLSSKTLNRFRLGLWLGFASVALMVGLCGYFAFLGDIVSARWTAVGVIASLAGVFVLQRTSSNQSKSKNQ